MSESTRRTFLLSAGAAAVAASAGPAAGDVNNRLRVALVGCGGRANAHLKCLYDLATDNVEIAALCDVDREVLNRRLAEVERKTGRRPAGFEDMRRAFD